MQYYTSDLHFSHVNIIKYCDRPYADVDAMDEDMIARWNALVTPQDDVMVLGDLALGRLEESLALASLLNGNKTLIPGNHDSCWKKHKRNDGARKLYYNAGFAIVDQPDPITIAGQRFQISHFPYLIPDTDQRYPDYRPIDRGEWLLHGHIHDRWRQKGRMVNVGIDAWGGTLITDADIAALVAAGAQDLDPIRWTN
jgi:calcineurin-like phosphoesterase family protein